jgi:pimeloyl-ACP methyl ester carboxylesterase
MDDLGAVLDAVGSTRTALFGASDRGQMCVLFAATYPERVTALVLDGTWARLLTAPDYPIGMPPEVFDGIIADAQAGWGTGAVMPRLCPSMATDQRFRDWWASWERLAASAGTAAAMMKVALGSDVRALLPTIGVPTPVIHRPAIRTRWSSTVVTSPNTSRGARLVELAGADHPHFVGDSEAVMAEVEEFEFVRWASRSAPGSTVARDRCRLTRSAGSPCTSAPGSPPSRSPGRCWFRRPSRPRRRIEADVRGSRST